MLAREQVLLHTGGWVVKKKLLSVYPEQMFEYSIEDTLIEYGRENKVIVGVIPGEHPWYFIEKEKEGFFEIKYVGFKGMPSKLIKSTAKYYLGFGKTSEGKFHAEQIISEPNLLKMAGRLEGYDMKEVSIEELRDDIIDLINPDRLFDLFDFLSDFSGVNEKFLSE